MLASACASGDTPDFPKVVIARQRRHLPDDPQQRPRRRTEPRVDEHHRSRRRQGARCGCAAPLLQPERRRARRSAPRRTRGSSRSNWRTSTSSRTASVPGRQRRRLRLVRGLRRAGRLGRRDHDHARRQEAEAGAVPVQRARPLAPSRRSGTPRRRACSRRWPPPAASKRSTRPIPPRPGDARHHNGRRAEDRQADRRRVRDARVLPQPHVRAGDGHRHGPAGGEVRRQGHCSSTSSRTSSATCAKTTSRTPYLPCGSGAWRPSPGCSSSTGRAGSPGSSRASSAADEVESVLALALETSAGGRHASAYAVASGTADRP